MNFPVPLRLVFPALFLLASPLLSEVVLIPGGAGTNWSYHEGGSLPAESWAKPDFDASAWKRGPGPIGYGQDDVATAIGFGGNASAKNVTAYFRASFTVPAKEAAKLEKLVLELRRDDGAVVFLNGKEVLRSNLPAGPVGPQTLASQALSAGEQEKFHRFTLPASLLALEGANTLAVEVHQANPKSSDLCLDLRLKALEIGEKSVGPVRDYQREGMTALRAGDYEKAAELLSQVPPENPNYAQIMAFLGYQIYGEALGRGKDGLPYAIKAYEKAPEDKEVVRAYLKTHVLSGVLFNPKDIARERSKTVAPEHAFLVTKPKWDDTSEKVSRAALEADLDQMEHILAKCFAYLELRKVDYRAALDAIRASLDDQTTVNAFELRLAKLISLFADGHAHTGNDESEFLPKGYAPYLAASHGGRVFLLNAEGTDFLDPARPYVARIDGKPIADWMKVAGYVAMKESPQWHHRLCLDMLRYVTYLRAELLLPQKDTITLALESEDGKSVAEKTVSVSAELPRRPEFPKGVSRRIGDVGYLRIRQMSGNAGVLAELDGWMAKFKDTRGLIIDLRGNTGGTKNILLTLFPYFMKPGAPMRIVELSTYRKPMDLPKANPGGYMMSSMSAQPVTSSRWKNDAERRQVADFIAAFRPEWPLPPGKFSEWHALGLDASANPSAYYYEKPLIILQDSGSFSASDIFLGAFEDHPNTTLMGMPSGGGNGWMENYTLPNSGLGLVLCQSAKFRPNGKLYDGVGIAPDVRLEATASDVLGRSDTVLEAAVKRLQAGADGK